MSRPSALTLTETERLFDVRAPAAGERRRDHLHLPSPRRDLRALRPRHRAEGRHGSPALAPSRETNEDELIRLMVGRDVLFRAHARRVAGEVVLEVERSVPRRLMVRDASFTVRAGEIVCLAGLVGSGRSETCEAIFGARRPCRRARSASEARAVRFGGPWDAIAAGIGMMPEDRKDGRPVPRALRRRQHLRDGAASRYRGTASSRRR